MSMNFGLSDYGKLKYMMEMADILKDKKRFEKEGAEANKKKIEESQKKATDLLKKLEEYASKTKSHAVVCYAQFQSMNGKEKFVQAIKGVGWCMRCCSKRHDYKRLRNRWMLVDAGPEPTVIFWENLHVGDFNRAVRSAIVYLITFIILIASIGGIVISQNYQNEASAKFDISKCSTTVEITQTQAYNDTQLPSTLQTGLLNCYCYNQLLQIG